MKKQIIILPVFILLVFVTNIYSQDWPQYLGPHRNSKSDEKGILRSWPETGPEVLWTVNVGIGYGGPIIKDGKVYLLDRDDKTGDNLRCFDLATGNELWNFAYPAPGSVMFPGSRSVPAIDGNYVYSCGHYGDLYCIDINTHQPVWNKQIWTDFGGQLPEGDPGFGGPFPTWAISQCPLVYGDLLILASQAPEAGVVAFDKRTGELKWKTPSLGKTGYVTPTIVKIDGSDHLVMITASSGGRGGQELVPGNVVGIDPLKGDILWKFTDWHCGIPVPGAVDAGDNKLLITGGYELGALMIQVEKKPDGSYRNHRTFQNRGIWRPNQNTFVSRWLFLRPIRNQQPARWHGMYEHERRNYVENQTRPDFNKGSIILADGLIMATDGAKMLYLIEPDPTAFKPISKAELLAEQKSDDERSSRHGTQNWAPIALSNGKLLIRDQSRMICVKVAE
jgi:outer membrane protein assembly factor BamB